MNLILDTDSYKASHFLQLPPGTTSMFHYLESRGGAYDQTVFFGLQYLLREHLSQEIDMIHVREAADFFKQHGLPFPVDGWTRVVKQHGGTLPLRIRAVPEGLKVPTHHVLMTVESTDPELPWLPGWLETQFVRLWYPITVATKGWYIKQMLLEALHETSDADAEAMVLFMLHDFGSRGTSSREQAAIGGMAHLVNFMGSDTVVGVDAANFHYDAGMAGFSIPAAEHSTITAWGPEGELDAFSNMLTQFARPGSLVAVVSDSYDIERAVAKYWGRELRQRVIDSGATVIIRPDSGYPPDMVVQILRQLAHDFGTDQNSKGYNVLKHVKVIQGDGLDEAMLALVVQAVKRAGFSLENVAFGMGGGLLQKINRDTLKFAYKCSSVTVNDQLRAVAKLSPDKCSKPGRLDLVRNSEGELETKELRWGALSFLESVMKMPYLNGIDYFHDTDLESVRKLARA